MAAKQRRRRFVLAFLILVGLAGILAFSAPGDDEGGSPPELAFLDGR